MTFSLQPWSSCTFPVVTGGWLLSKLLIIFVLFHFVLLFYNRWPVFFFVFGRRPFTIFILSLIDPRFLRLVCRQITITLISQAVSWIDLVSVFKSHNFIKTHDPYSIFWSLSKYDSRNHPISKDAYSRRHVGISYNDICILIFHRELFIKIVNEPDLTCLIEIQSALSYRKSVCPIL